MEFYNLQWKPVWKPSIILGKVTFIILGIMETGVTKVQNGICKNEK